MGRVSDKGFYLFKGDVMLEYKTEPALCILQANKTFVEAIKILYYGQINLQTQFIELCFVKKVSKYIL